MRLHLCIGLLFATAMGLCASAARTQDAATGLIVGQVVDGQTGRGVPEAWVMLRQFVPPEFVNTRSETSGYTKPLPDVVADEEGRFYFAGVGAGRFELVIVKEGYLSAGSGQEYPGGAKLQLDLAAGDRRTGVRLPMWKAAVIAGTVTDERGEPVIGASVRLLKRVTRNGWQAFTPVAVSERTDDLGEFRIPGLSPGAYLLAMPGMRFTIPARLMAMAGISTEEMQIRGGLMRISNEIVSIGSSAVVTVGDQAWQTPSTIPRPPAPRQGEPLLTYPATFYPSATDLTQAELISVGPGEQFIAAHLRLQSVPTVTVSGTVTSLSSQAPLQGGTAVRLIDAAFADVLPQEFSIAAAPSDANGSFVMLGVPPGKYIAVADSIQERPAAQGGMVGHVTAVPVTVGTTPVSDLLLNAQAMPAVSGLAVLEGGEPSDRAGDAGRMAVEPATAATSVTVGSPNAPDSSGTFRLLLRPGRYFLTPQPRSPWTVKSITHAGRNLYDAPLDVGTESITDVIVTYTMSPAARLEGTAGLDDSTYPAGVVIVVFPADPALRAPGAQPPHRFRSAAASLNGAFSVPSMPPGQYLVAAIAQEHVPDWRSPATLEHLSRAAQSVTLRSGGATIVTLKVTPVPVRDPLLPSSDAGVDPLERAHGPFVPEQAAQSAVPQRRDVARPAAVVGGGRLEGVVVSTEEPATPLRNARVSAQSTDRRFGLTVPSDDEGRFVLDGLPPGEFRLTVDKPGWLGIPFGATRPGGLGTSIPLAEAQQRTGVTMHMARGAVLSGLVMNARSVPMPGVRVEALRYQLHALTGQMQLQSVGSDTTDDLGAFRIHSLRAGDYVLRATDPGASSRSVAGAVRRLSRDDVNRAIALGARPVSTLPDVPPADVGPVMYPDSTGSAMLALKTGHELRGLHIVMTPEPLSVVRGLVRRADGLPFTVGLSLFRGGPDAERQGLSTVLVAEARADAQGRFAFRPMAAGTYTVRAKSDGGLLWAEQTVIVAGGVDVALDLQPTMTVRGRVVLEGTDVTTVTVPPISVWLLPAGTGSELNGPRATAAADGSFTLTGILPGRYAVANLAMPSAEWTLRESVANGRAAADASLTVEPGQDVEWELRFTKEPSRLTGTFTNASGRPASEYTLVVFTQNRAHWRPTSRSIRTMRPNTDGTFSVVGLPPGTYHLAAVTDIENGDQFDADFLDTLIPSALTVVIRDKTTTTQDIRIGGGV